MEKFAPGYGTAANWPRYAAHNSSSSSSSSSSDTEPEQQHLPERAQQERVRPLQAATRKGQKESNSSEDSGESAEEDREEYTGPDVADSSSSSDSDAPPPRPRTITSRGKLNIPAEFLRRSGRDRKKVETYVDEDSTKRLSKYMYSDEDDDHEDGDGDSSEVEYDGGSRTKRRGPLRKKVVSIGPTSGRRRTGRAKASVNYADDYDDNSDDEAYERIQNAKKRKAALATENPDFELEEGDIIESVIEHRWFQEDHGDGIMHIDPDGTKGEDILGPETRDENGGHLKFQVKWKGWSHFHNTWGSRQYLSQFNGFNKVATYLKKWDEHVEQYEEWPPEEQEAYDLEREMSLELIRGHMQVQRIVAQRQAVRPGAGDIEYLTKWEGLTYDEATWEGVDDIKVLWQSKIDDYNSRRRIMREQNQKRETGFASRIRGRFQRYDVQPEWLQGGKLRGYQLTGINWLYHQWCRNINTILADEMGLGKTLQSVAFLSILQYERNIPGPFLLVVPLITVEGWHREIRKWLPDMNVIVYLGNQKSRSQIQEYELYATGSNGVRTKQPGFNAVITTYEMLLKDKDMLKQFNWEFLVVDEAHRLKNSQSRLYGALTEMKTANRLLVTGTPMQNDIQELWCLLHFLMPDKFNDLDTFKDKFDDLTLVQELHEQLKPHLLRREKRDAERSLPPKSYRILRVELSPMQKEFYKWIINRNFMELSKGVKGAKLSLLNIVMELRKVCNHPFVFERSGYEGSIVDMSPRSMAKAKSQSQQRLRDIIRNSGKLILLDKMLTQLHGTEHRVLIFSQFVSILDVLEDYLKLKGFAFQRIDGKTPKQKRFQAMDHFNAEGSSDFVFLLSTKAGGLGINLATADTVVIYDSDWNPQNDLQAESRAHRIGQKNAVNVYRLVTKNTVEEDIIERAKRKLVNSTVIISGMDTAGTLAERGSRKEQATKFSREELNAMLRFGATELFKKDTDKGVEDEDDAVERIASSFSMDDLLTRPTYETARNDEDDLTGRRGDDGVMGAFNVADFDDDFWSKTVPVEEQEAAKKVVEKEEHIAEPSVRTARLQQTNYAEDSLAKARGGSDDDSDDDYAGSKKNRKKDLAPETDGGLTQKQQKQFIKAFRKFGIVGRIKDMLKDPALSVLEEHPMVEFETLAESLIQACKSRKEELKTKTSENAHLAAAPRDPNVQFCGLKINAIDLLQRRKNMQFIEKRVSELAPDPTTRAQKFRVHGLLKSSNSAMLKKVEWNDTDDAMLLLGTHIYGWGSFDLMRQDSSLELQDKIPPDSTKAIQHGSVLPKKEYVLRRVDSLIKALKVAKNMRLEKSSRTGNEGASSESSAGATRRPPKLKETTEKRRKKDKARMQSPTGEGQRNALTASADARSAEARSNPPPDHSRKLEAREAVKPLDQMLRSLVRLPSQYEGKQLAKVLQKHIKHIGSQVDSIAHRQAFSQEMLFKEIGAAVKRICRVEGVEPMALHDGDKLHAMYSKIKAKLAKRAAEAQLVAPESEGAATFADVQPHTAAARVSIKHGAAFRAGSETRGSAAGRIGDGGCDSGGLANSNHRDSDTDNRQHYQDQEKCQEDRHRAVHGRGQDLQNRSGHGGTTDGRSRTTTTSSVGRGNSSWHEGTSSRERQHDRQHDARDNRMHRQHAHPHKKRSAGEFGKHDGKGDSNSSSMPPKKRAHADVGRY